MVAVATAQYGQRTGETKGADAADNLGGSDAKATHLNEQNQSGNRRLKCQYLVHRIQTISE